MWHAYNETRYPQVPGTLRKLLKVYGTLKLSKFQELKDCSVERKSVPKQRDSGIAFKRRVLSRRNLFRRSENRRNGITHEACGGIPLGVPAKKMVNEYFAAESCAA
jgi:hypothetical protein